MGLEPNDRAAEISDAVKPEQHNRLYDDVLAPAANAALIQPFNTVANVVNGVSDKFFAARPLGKHDLLATTPAKFGSTDWILQSLSGGLAMTVPYGLAGKATGGALRGVGQKSLVEGAAAKLLQSNLTAQVSGAALYDSLRDTAPGETRLGNTAAGAVSFGIFGKGNQLLRGHELPGRLLGNAGIGAAGGLAHTFIADGISQHRLPTRAEMGEGALSGAAMNVALPAVQDRFSRAVDSVNMKLGRGIPVDRFVEGDSDLAPAFRSSSALKQLHSQYPWARVRTGAAESFAADNKINLANDLAPQAKAGVLAHEWEHLRAQTGYKHDPYLLQARTQLQQHDEAAAWDSFKQARFNHELSAQASERTVAYESGAAAKMDAPGNASASPEIIRDSQSLSQRPAAGGKTYEQLWREEFEEFKRSGGEKLPHLDRHEAALAADMLPPTRPQAELNSLGHVVQATYPESVMAMWQRDGSGYVVNRDGFKTHNKNGVRTSEYDDVRIKIEPDGSVAYFLDKAGSGRLLGGKQEPISAEEAAKILGATQAESADGSRVVEDRFGNKTTTYLDAQTQAVDRIVREDAHGYKSVLSADHSFIANDPYGYDIERSAAGKVDMTDPFGQRRIEYPQGASAFYAGDNTRYVYLHGDKLTAHADGAADYQFASGARLTKSPDRSLTFQDDLGRVYLPDENYQRRFADYVKATTDDRAADVLGLSKPESGKHYDVNAPLDGNTLWQRRIEENKQRLADLHKLPLSLEGWVLDGGSEHQMKWGHLTAADGATRRTVVHISDNDVYHHDPKKAEGAGGRLRRELGTQSISANLFGTFPATVKRTISIDGKETQVWLQDATGEDIRPALRKQAERENKSMDSFIDNSPELRNEIERALLERSMVGDTDMHEGNVSFEAGATRPHIRNIDMDMAFSLMRKPVWRDYNSDEDIISRATRELAGKPLSASSVGRIEEFVNKFDSDSGRAQLTSSGLKPQEVEALLARAHWFKENKTFPPLLPGLEFVRYQEAADG